MSNLSNLATQQIVDFVDTALRGSQFGRPDGDVDKRAAAIALTNEYRIRSWTPTKTVDATRKLFERVLNGRVARLQTAQAAYLINLMRCLGFEIDLEADSLVHLLATPLGRWQVEWFYPATGDEAEALRLPTWDLDALVEWYMDRLVAPVHRDLVREGIRIRMGALVALARDLLGATPSGRDASRTRLDPCPLAPAFLGALDALERDARAGEHSHQPSVVLDPACPRTAVPLAPIRRRVNRLARVNEIPAADSLRRANERALPLAAG